MKNVVVLLMACFLSFPLFAQIEVGLVGGGAFYFGDLSSTNQKTFQNAREALGLYVRYNYQKNLSFRLGWTGMQVIGSDAQSETSTRKRNLNFVTSISEFSLMPEYNFANVKIGESGKFSAFVAAGVSVFNFTPYTYYNGRVVNLSKIGTEGQNIPNSGTTYKTTALAIPHGLGVKMAVNDVLSIEMAYLNRYTFSDYIDDVSTVYPDFDLLKEYSGHRAVKLSDRSLNGATPGKKRGNAESNDWYGTFTFGIGVNLGSLKMGKKK